MITFAIPPENSLLRISLKLYLVMNLIEIAILEK